MTPKVPNDHIKASVVLRLSRTPNINISSSVMTTVSGSGSKENEYVGSGE